MIRVKAKGMTNPVTKEVKYYMAIDDVTHINLKEVARRIEKISTVSSADIKGTLDALQYVVQEALLSGQSVRLGDLGSFRPTITSNGVLEMKDVDTTLIKGVRVRYTPSGALRQALSLGAGNVQFTSVSSGNAEGE